MQDNLNTHAPGALYETFPAAQARRILQRLECHDTPKHASWLNMADIEIGIFQRSCLHQRIPDTDTLQHHVQALQDERNIQQRRIVWQFSMLDARKKLRRLYPTT